MRKGKRESRDNRGAGGVQKLGEERVGDESSKRGGSGRNYSIITIKTGLRGKPRKKGQELLMQGKGVRRFGPS